MRVIRIDPLRWRGSDKAYRCHVCPNLARYHVWMNDNENGPAIVTMCLCDDCVIRAIRARSVSVRRLGDHLKMFSITDLSASGAMRQLPFASRQNKRCAKAGPALTPQGRGMFDREAR